MNIQGLFYALCQTFLHSMWQGLIAAILGGVILLTTKRSSPLVRYYLLLTVFAAFMIAAGVTFYMVLPVAEASQLPVNIGMNAVITTVVADPVQPGLGKMILDYLSAHSQLIVTVWFVVFLIKMANIFSGLIFVQYMRRHSVGVHASWQNKVNVLAAALQLRRPVKLLESAIAKVPMTAGFFKPVIYVPAGMVLGLPAEEIEAILLHELGHIRRGDYFVNLFQCLAEAIFFFNPALLWISSLLRSEREHCCDEIAVNGTTDKRNYIRALVAFQEYSANTRAALHLTEKKGHLAARVKRMITRENKKLNAGEKTILLISSIALLIFLASLTPAPRIIRAESISIAPTSKEEPTPAKHDLVIPGVSRMRTGVSPKPSIPRVQSDTPSFRYIPANLTNVKGQTMSYAPALDTVPNFRSISTTSNDDGTTRTQDITATDAQGNKYHYKTVNGKVTFFSMNDQVIDEADYRKYNEVFQRVKQEQDERIHKAIERQQDLLKQHQTMDSLHKKIIVREKELKAQHDAARADMLAMEQEKMMAATIQRKKMSLQRDSMMNSTWELNRQQNEERTREKKIRKAVMDSTQRRIVQAEQEYASTVTSQQKRQRAQWDSLRKAAIEQQQVIIRDQIRMEKQAHLRQDSIYKLHRMEQLNMQLEQLRRDSIRLRQDMNMKRLDERAKDNDHSTSSANYKPLFKDHQLPVFATAKAATKPQSKKLFFSVVPY